MCFGKEEAKKSAIVHEEVSSILEDGLSYGDKIKFGDRTYEVEIDHLSNISGGANVAILHDLGVEDEHAFCSEHYGYRAPSGGWPECKDRDYEALARVAVAVFALLGNDTAVTIRKAAKDIVKFSEAKSAAVAKLASLKSQIAQAEKAIIDADAKLDEATAKLAEAQAKQKEEEQAQAELDAAEAKLAEEAAA